MSRSLALLSMQQRTQLQPLFFTADCPPSLVAHGFIRHVFNIVHVVPLIVIPIQTWASTTAANRNVLGLPVRGIAVWRRVHKQIKRSRTWKSCRPKAGCTVFLSTCLLCRTPDWDAVLWIVDGYRPEPTLALALLNRSYLRIAAMASKLRIFPRFLCCSRHWSLKLFKPGGRSLQYLPSTNSERANTVSLY